ncbi:MAG: 1,2-phenylacetyl-CoA epoxidase subunit PaaD [Sandaracinaceae bacterium]
MSPAEARGWALLREVVDPELPFLSVVDLGVARRVEVLDGRVVVGITPTYSGCPALEVIEADVAERLRQAGLDPTVERDLAPPWSSDWISAEGRRKLKDHGMAPPGPAGDLVALRVPVRCPRCGSPDTEELSAFGSTACKALHRCRSCREPFDLVKAH